MKGISSHSLLLEKAGGIPYGRMWDVIAPNGTFVVDQGIPMEVDVLQAICRLAILGSNRELFDRELFDVYVDLYEEEETISDGSLAWEGEYLLGSVLLCAVCGLVYYWQSIGAIATEDYTLHP